MDNITIGQAIQFKHGESPVVTVLNKDRFDQTLQCGWFDKNHVYHEEWFPLIAFRI